MTADSVTPEINAWLDRFVVWKDNGKPPRSNYAYDKWDYAKLGTVNHIPVCETLEQLDAYFCGGNAQGSTHFGTGRDYEGDFEAGGYSFPSARVSQYMATVGPYSPWAQGVIQNWGSCSIPAAPILGDYRMQSGEPNCAFLSNENVAMSGSDGVTDPQFNSNVMLRAWGALYFDHDITPYTQLWHAEIDRVDRCFDPGWEGALEDEMQAAANAVRVGDYSKMRQAVAVGPPPEPEPEPPPADNSLWPILCGIINKVSTGDSVQLELAYIDLGALLGHNPPRVG
jgi:hypothetical protein